MGYIGVITHLLTIDPNFQPDIQVVENPSVDHKTQIQKPHVDRSLSPTAPRAGVLFEICHVIGAPSPKDGTKHKVPIYNFQHPVGGFNPLETYILDHSSVLGVNINKKYIQNRP